MEIKKGLDIMTGRQERAIIAENKIGNRCVNVRYPKVEGLKNREAQDRINESIRQRVLSLIPPEGCDAYEVITGNYDVKLNEKGILSIRLEVYTFAKQAANGLTTAVSITTNLDSGRVYQLHQLFRPDSDYRIILTKMIQQQISERGIPLIKEFTGISDNRDYYLADGALTIYFQEIEYTPHYYGIVEFPIPYARIRNIISQEGPAAGLTDPD